MKLFSFWRSLATFRVRIALNLKGLTPEEVIDVDLMKGRQRDAKYRAVNPQMLLPALVDGEGPALFQSLAIMEYLDETHPRPPLLPQGARARARVRGLAQIVACDSHPLLVPRVREYLPAPTRRAAGGLSMIRFTSCAGLTRASIFFEEVLRRKMDCRVKPGNDDGEISIN